MKSKIKVIILMISVLFLITGCNDPCRNLSTTKITSMEYKKAWTSYAYTGKIMIPIYHSEEYLIIIDSCSIRVDEETFNKYKVGDNYEGEDLTDE